MKHLFIPVEKNDVSAALDFYLYRLNGTEMIFEKKCYLSDAFVIHHKELFVNINVYIQNFNKSGNKIDYHGKTIIPPASVKIIYDRLCSNRVLLFKLKLYRESRNFLTMIQYSLRNDLFIVHLGV